MVHSSIIRSPDAHAPAVRSTPELTYEPLDEVDPSAPEVPVDPRASLKATVAMVAVGLALMGWVLAGGA